MRSPSLSTASPAPDQIAPRPTMMTGFFDFAMRAAACSTAAASSAPARWGSSVAVRGECGSLFHHCRAQRAGAVGLERGGRMIRLVVVPLLLLHVHRTAQHDRT